MTRLTRADLAARDRTDPLRHFRERFELPAGVVYLDGNSLGPLPKATPARVAQVVREEWGRDLIKSWNLHGWIDLPARVGGKIARLIGADADEVVCADSTSVNLFKLLAAALKLRPERKVILTDAANFPTDVYIAEGLAGMLGQGYAVRTADMDGMADAIDEDVAVVSLTHVSYRTGAMYDMPAITAKAHRHGCLMLWDLAHSAGAMPVDLQRCGADFAVGCGYKYLNGGPGAPAFLYVAKRHQERIAPPLSGWLGHAAPFAFEPRYRPAGGILRQLCGTPQILSLAALEVGVDMLLEADLAAVREKSLAMAEVFVELVEQECAAHGFTVVSPRDPDRRGSQACLAHGEGYAIMQALIGRGVIGDFRAPDVLRFGFTPLYVGFAELWDAVATLRDVMDSGAWDRPEHKTRAAVT